MNVLYLGQKIAVATELQALLVQPRPADSASSTANAAVEFERVSSQKHALAAMKRQPPHVLIVEMSPQPGSRADFLRTVRYRYAALAVIAIGESEPHGQAQFDGWLSLPLATLHVHQTMAALDSRHGEHWVGNERLRLNLNTREVQTARGAAQLKPKEAALLHLLIQRRDRNVTRREIMQEIWDTSYVVDTRTLDVHVRWLREKIEADPAHPALLITVRNVGYRLNLERA